MFYRPHARVVAPVGEVSMTKQSMKAECDINNILSQYKKTGMITHIKNNAPLYVDLPDAIDYQTSLNILMQADVAFAALPSKVRDRFGNDPERFLAAFSDPALLPELRELGLLKPKRPEDPRPAAAPAAEGGA